MTKKVFQLLAFAYLMASCADEKISIPFPVTHAPVRISERQIKLSMSVVENGNEGIKTGFAISRYADLFPSSIIYADYNSGAVFFSTLNEERLFSGVDYYIKSYIEFNKKKIYGNDVVFTTSSGFNQSISSVVPGNGKVNDTFEIHGQNFVPEFTEVWLRHNNSDKSFHAELISVSKNKIVAKVPHTEGIYGSMYLNLYINFYDGTDFIAHSFFTVDPD